MKRSKLFFGGLFFIFVVIFSTNLFPQNFNLTKKQEVAKKTLKKRMPKFTMTWNSKLRVPLAIKGVLSQELELRPEAVKGYFAENFKDLYEIQQPDQEISAGTFRRDARGFSRLVLFQKYKGIPVYGISLRLGLSKEKRLRSVIGKWIPNLDLSVSPRLNRDQAMTRLAFHLRRLYRGASPLPASFQIRPDRIELVVFNPGIYSDDFSLNYLAYHVKILTWVFFVDAQTGNILYSYNNLQFAKNRNTHNSDDCVSGLPGILIIDESGPVGGAIPDAATWNAHNFAGQTYDYFWNTHGRDSLDGGGMTIVQTVHSGIYVGLVNQILCCILGLPCCSGCEQLNAGWDPTRFQVCYGDGGTFDDGRTVGPLCNANDVVAHELTHAVTQYSIEDIDGNPVGLDYSGQSGALNESFSDFFGVMVDRDDWLLAEDLFGDGSALRNMADPTVYDQPDHMDNYAAGGDVHLNSGIPNKVAYLMSEGGVHPHSGIAVAGIGKEAAERILYQSLTMHLGQTSTLLEARVAALFACDELYPGDIAKYATVWNAFVACGICDPAVPNDCRPFAPIEGRDPVDIVLLLDFSDSMNDLAEPGGRQKIEVLKDAAELFLRTWELFALSEDRVALIYFDSDVHPLAVNFTPLISNVNSLVSEIRLRPTGMYTAMGGALQTALSGLSSGASNPALIAFTNGIQNVNPMAVDVGGHYEIITSSGAWGGTSSVPPNPGVAINSYAVPVHVIGIGQAAATSYHELLSDVCSETGGLLHLTTSPDTDLRRFYIEDLVAALHLATLEMVDYKYGELRPQQPMVESFELDAAVTRAAFVVHWVEKSGVSFPAFAIQGPDGTRLPPTRWVTGPYYRVAVFDFPYQLKNKFVYPAGTWRISAAAAPEAGVVSYQASLLVDEVQLDYDFRIAGRAHWTGEPLVITARVTEAGIPLTNLKRVWAGISQPRTPLGTFLSVHRSGEAAVFNRSDLLSSRAQLKLHELLKKPELRKQLAPLAASIEMFDDGKPEHGDAQPGDGIYSGKVDDTRIPGLYRFRIHAEGISLTGWPLRRQQEASAVVRVKPDREATLASARWLEKTKDGAGTALFQITPLDRFNNYLGPDYDSAIKAEAESGEIVAPAQDVLDGSYEIRIRVPDRTKDPLITVQCLNLAVYQDTLSRALRIRHPFWLSGHLGFTRPTGQFDALYDSGWSAAVDLEYVLRPDISLQALLGFNAFTSALEPATDWLNLSADVKYYLASGTPRPFLNGGLGVYKAKGEAALHFGLNAGAGLSVRMSPRFYADAGLNFHSIMTGGNNTNFLVAYVGVRFQL